MKILSVGDRRTSRVVLQPGRHWVKESVYVYLNEPTEVTLVEHFGTSPDIGWHMTSYDLSEPIARPEKLGRFRRVWRFLFRRQRPALPEARVVRP